MIKPYDDLQEIFDKVWKNFIVNKKPAGVRFGQINPFPFTSIYKGPKGSCPIGLLIPDEIYNSYIEGKTIKYLIRTDKKLAYLFSNIKMDILFDLQKCHDYSLESVIYGRNFFDEMKFRLMAFAKWYDLTVKEE